MASDGLCLACVSSGSPFRDKPIRPHSFHEDGRGGQVIAERRGLGLTKEQFSSRRHGEIDDIAAAYGLVDIAPERVEEEELVAPED